MKKTYHKTSNECELATGHSLSFGRFAKHHTKQFAARHQSQYQYHHHQLAFLSLVFLLSLTTIVTTTLTTIIGSNSSSASALTYQDSVDLDFTFNPTLNLTITGGDLNIDGLTPGNYHDSNIITVTSGSNSVTGYTLYANVGSSTINYTDLRINSNNTNSANIFTSLSSNKGTLASFDGGTWGYSYSTDAGTTWISGDFDDPNVSSHTGYNGLPLYSSNSGIKLAKTTAPSNPSTIQFKIGAKASSTQASGTYTNTVNFISVGNVVTTSYTMNYVDTTNEATNMPTTTTGTTTNGIFTLTSTIPSRTDYHFKGWCTVDNSTNPTICSDGTNTGTIIEPGGQYVIGSTDTNFTGTVYAMWTTGYMQNISLSTLAALMPNIGDSTTLLDSRDNQPYTIAKLADGKYWMTKNLNLAGGTALSADDTDVSATYISNYTSSTTESENGRLVKSDNTLVLPASSTSGFDTDNYSYVYNSGNVNDGDTITCGGSGQNTPCYSYYSWDAATLGSGRDITTQNTDAPYSICPKGWRLPTSGQHNGDSSSTTNSWKRGDFYRLLTAYGVNLEGTYYQDTATFWNNAGAGTVANFLLSGDYRGSTFSSGGAGGGYWSSTSTSSTSSRNLGFNTGAVNSAGSNYRKDGFSIRCLYQPTMQNINKTDLATLMPNTHDSTTLRDSRDNQDYTVAKLADGKYWMTKNLNVAGGTVLTSADTDMPVDYILPTANGFNTENVLPTSSVSGFSDSNTAYIYNTGNDTDDCVSPGCYSYYSWTAATLGSGLNIVSENTDAPYSICPKKWKLPNSGSTANSSWKRGDFYALATAYGANLENSYYSLSPIFFNNAGPGTTANFLLAGYRSSSFYDGNTNGPYWSATWGSSGIGARYFNFSSSIVDSAGGRDRKVGESIRCIFNV